MFSLTRMVRQGLHPDQVNRSPGSDMPSKTVENLVLSEDE